MFTNYLLPDNGPTLMGCNWLKTLSFDWWPKMNSDIVSMVKSCPSCQMIRPMLPSTLIIPWEFPKAP